MSREVPRNREFNNCERSNLFGMRQSPAGIESPVTFAGYIVLSWAT